VGFDRAGSAIAIWGDCGTGRDRIVAGARTPGLNGQWQTPVALSTAGRVAVEPVLTVDGRGDAVASWGESDGEWEVVQASTRSGSTGAWEPAVQVSSTGAYAYESVSAIDEQGDAIVGFTRSDPAGPIVWAAYRPGGGPWLASVQLSQPGDYGVFPTVALDPRGNAIAVWSEDFAGRSSFRSRATGEWEAPTAFPTGYLTDIATDSKGDAVAAWGEGTAVWVSRRRAGAASTWTGAAPVAQVSGAIDVHVDVDNV
jgi:hypothetical protein